MPTQRVHDTAGQIEQDVPVVEPEPVEPAETTAAKPLAELVQEPASAPEPESSASDGNAGFSTAQVAALERLRSLGARRASVKAELEAIERELLGDAIPSSFKLGLPKRLIAKESGVVRQTVYNVLARVE